MSSPKALQHTSTYSADTAALSFIKNKSVIAEARKNYHLFVKQLGVVIYLYINFSGSTIFGLFSGLSFFTLQSITHIPNGSDLTGSPSTAWADALYNDYVSFKQAAINQYNMSPVVINNIIYDKAWISSDGKVMLCVNVLPSSNTGSFSIDSFGANYTYYGYISDNNQHNPLAANGLLDGDYCLSYYFGNKGVGSFGLIEPHMFTLTPNYSIGVPPNQSMWSVINVNSRFEVISYGPNFPQPAIIQSPYSNAWGDKNNISSGNYIDINSPTFDSSQPNCIQDKYHDVYIRYNEGSSPLQVSSLISAVQQIVSLPIPV